MARMKKGKRKQRLWARVVIVRDDIHTPTGIDFPVTPTTTIQDFGDLEQALNEMFEGAKFDLDYHWEPVEQVHGYEGRRSKQS